MPIAHIKCECQKYLVPQKDCEPFIAVSTNKDELLVAVINNKKDIILYKLENEELTQCCTLYNGNRNKIVGLEWSRQNSLLIIFIDMSCLIYRKNENEQWKHNTVNIPTEEIPTCVCWHPYAHAFAIGFSSGVVFICSRKEKQKWSIKKLSNHIGSILHLKWSFSGHVLSTCSTDETSLLLCTLRVCEDSASINNTSTANNSNNNYVNGDEKEVNQHFQEIFAQRNFKNNEVINKIERKGCIFLYSSFSLSSKRIAIIASNFNEDIEKQQIIICDFLKTPTDTQFVTWLGQSLQKCLFLDEQRLLVYGYEMFPILLTCSSNEWLISSVILPEFSIPNLCVDFFFDKKRIAQIEEEYEHMDGNKLLSEIIPHSNHILQISMIESFQNENKTITKTQIQTPNQFVTVSTDFNIILWTLPL